MNRDARISLERELRTAEQSLATRREVVQEANAAVDAQIRYLEGGAGDLRNDAKLDRLVSREDKAKAEHDEALEKRDGLLRRLAEAPISAVINDHDGTFGEARGVPLGFNGSALHNARAHLLGDNPTPLRLGPPLGGEQPSRMMAIADSGDWAQGLVPSYDISIVFPWLREQPRVAAIFPADTIDTVSRIYFRFSAPADQAAVVAEGAGKPESTPNTEQVTVTPQAVAHYGKFTRQLLLNAPNFLDQYIGEFVSGLNLAVDEGLVSGNGSGELNGIENAAGINTYLRDTTNESRLDAILGGITAVRTSAYREPTHLIIHPTDLEAARKEKASTAGLYLANPGAALWDEGSITSLWGLTVVATTSATLGTAIVIDPVTFGTLVVRLPVIAEVDPYSLFTTNEYQLRVETMLDLCCVRAKAACLVEDL